MERCYFLFVDVFFPESRLLFENYVTEDSWFDNLQKVFQLSEVRMRTVGDEILPLFLAQVRLHVVPPTETDEDDVVCQSTLTIFDLLLDLFRVDPPRQTNETFFRVESEKVLVVV